MFRQLLANRLPKTSANRPARRHSRRLAVEALEDRCLPATFNWIGPVAGGDFNTAANWRDQANNNAVPGPDDDAVLPNNATVTVSQSHTVNSVRNSFNGGAQLNITAGTFTLNNVGQNAALGNATLAAGATLRVNGGTTFLDGGTFAGNLDVDGDATLAFRHNTNSLNAGVSLTGAGKFLVGGDTFSSTVTLNTDLTAPADFTLQNGVLNGGGDLTIAAGTTFTWVTTTNGSATMGGNGTTTVEAGATLNIAGTAGFNAPILDTRTLDNFGTVNVGGNGEFAFRGGGTLHNQVGGVVNITTDVALNGGSSGRVVNDGTLTKTNPVASGTATLAVTLNNTGTVHVQSGTLAVGGGGTNSGTFTADADARVTFPNIFSSYTLNGGSQLTGAGLFDVVSGTVNLAGATSVSNLQLSGGTISGAGTLTPAVFTCSSGTLASPTVIPAGATLTLATGGNKQLNGNLTNNGTVNVASTTNVGLGNNPTITNNGEFNLQFDKDLSGNALFQNAGTLTKTSAQAGGTTVFGPQLINTGTVDLQGGVLQLRNGGTSTGTWNAGPDGTLEFDGGTYDLNAGTTFTGEGRLRLTSANLRVTGAVTAENFNVAGGELNGTSAGTFTVTDTLDWAGGTFNNPNLIVKIPVGAALILQGTADKSLGSGTLELAGTAVWKDTGNLGTGGSSDFEVLAGATFTIENGQQLGGGTFHNAGTLVKTGTGTTVVSVFNTFTNTGTINVQGGVFELAGDLTQTAGAITVAAGAALRVGSFSGELNLNGGTLSAATLDGNLNNATNLVFGGTLTVTGNYTQTAAGTLTVNASGTAAGTGFNQLVVGGRATLAGGLSLNSINGFATALGHSFPVITYQSASGTLTVGGNLTPGSGNQFTATRGATSFGVTVTQIPPPPPGPVTPSRPVSRTVTRTVTITAPIGATLITKRIKKKVQVSVRVTYSGGRAARTITSPFAQPAYKGIRVALVDSNGDGTYDRLLFTARKGRRTVKSLVAV